jgi:hypothetical protein
VGQILPLSAVTPIADIRRCIGPTGSIDLTEIFHSQNGKTALNATTTLKTIREVVLASQDLRASHVCLLGTKTRNFTLRVRSVAKVSAVDLYSLRLSRSNYLHAREWCNNIEN